uniref:Chromo domain-containing protein n=2 Tax=Aegilops tauschii subsp. strangulata TaxID=200361 RepID=A0A453SEU2_AEGTS
HVGHQAVPLPHVPLVTPEGYIKTIPVAVLDRRIIQRNKTPVGQCLVQWESLAPDDATWEDAAFLNKTFPGHKLFRLEDKAIVMAAALSGPEPRAY